MTTPRLINSRIYRARLGKSWQHDITRSLYTLLSHFHFFPIHWTGISITSTLTLVCRINYSNSEALKVIFIYYVNTSTRGRYRRTELADEPTPNESITSSGRPWGYVSHLLIEALWSFSFYYGWIIYCKKATLSSCLGAHYWHSQRTSVDFSVPNRIRHTPRKTNRTWIYFRLRLIRLNMKVIWLLEGPNEDSSEMFRDFIFFREHSHRHQGNDGWSNESN